MTEQEWKRRCAAQYQSRVELSDADAAQAAAATFEACQEAAAFEKNLDDLLMAKAYTEPDVLDQSPEDAADDDLTYWDADE